MATPMFSGGGAPLDPNSNYDALMAEALGVEAPEETPTDPYQDKKAILEFQREEVRLAFGDHRIAMERLWQQIIKYLLGDQWIFFHPSRKEWIPKRLHKWIPRPVTNMMAGGLRSIRALFASVNVGVVVRPLGRDPKNVTAAAVGDEMHPVIHDEHKMDAQLFDADFWFAGIGNVFLHPWWDVSPANGTTFVQHEQCQGCGNTYPPDKLLGEPTQPVCPDCRGSEFTKAEDAEGPIGDDIPKGVGRTDVVSPFEMGFSASYTQFDDLPTVTRKRWRTRSYMVAKYGEEFCKQLNFDKTPNDRGLQMMQSLITEHFIVGKPAVTANSDGEDGIVEYETWVKPSETYPQGLVSRMAGDKLIDDPDESIPGPLPSTDVNHSPLFPWVHAGYDKVGGRIWARGPMELVLQKQDQINQLDSLIQLIIQRMANPVWLEPKGAEVEKFTGEPGLVVKFNPIGPNGTGEPKRIPGEGPDQALFSVREQYVRDFEELLGTFDILKGQRPPNIEAFSALQLLVERSQAGFAAVLKERGRMYRDWYKLALEMERQYGPEARVHAIMGPNRRWAFKNFQNADLQGAMAVLVEDGTNIPKTALGQRAAIEQANQMKLLNIADSDERFELLKRMGLSDISPSLSADVEECLREQQAWEEWVEAGAAGANPLKIRPWHGDGVHVVENRKWMNSDRVRELLSKFEQMPAQQAPDALPDPMIVSMADQLVADLGAHLQMHMQQQALKMMAMQAGQPQKPGAGSGPGSEPGGAGRAMQNSNAQSGKSTPNDGGSPAHPS